MDSPKGVAVVVIVMRHRRNRQRSTRGVPGFACQRAGWELIFMHQRSVIWAPHMLREEQMTRSPHVAKEREYRERSDDRIAGSPEARLNSGSTTGELHGRPSAYFWLERGEAVNTNATRLQNRHHFRRPRSIQGRQMTNGLRGAETREIIQP